MICAACGAENRDGARFCDSCGAPLAVAAPREQRKVVTVLFCDVSGSTALGEQLDPEALRTVMGRYFDVARAAIERHGGTLEKFIGDAVMAVFGVPTVREDDALRAVRAAQELRDAVEIDVRIGVNTGEVVTGSGDSLVTGDAVNVAARLEQAAGAGEVLLGDATHRLVRDAVDAELLPPLEAKGKSTPVTAYRLRAVTGDVAVARRQDARLVGREREQRMLRDAWERALSERACALVTILGSAGVGKSRLAAEILDGVDATIVRGRCLSYGEGITYWPVVEIVKQLLGEDPPPNAALAALLGDGTASADEVAAAVRKLLESAAPVVVLLDDIHWGEPTFLDLVEHVADWSRDAPILLLCLARPDLLDLRPTWGGGKLNATTALLEPLSADEARALVDELLGARGIEDALRDRIMRAADGNPFFVEQMIAMLEESPADVQVPVTVRALLAARLDQLSPAERQALERGAVEGQLFHRGADAALAPDDDVSTRLPSLVRKELIRPAAAMIANDDAFRFRHLLIRDAAYEALPKAQRAELHERFADWLELHGADLVELDEILGYHLEETARFRAELGLDGSGPARRAADLLGRAGLRARRRLDLPAASGLLARAVALLPDADPERDELAFELALSYREEGRLVDAEAAADEALRHGDADTKARARVVRAAVRAMRGVGFDEGLREVQDTVAGLEGLSDATAAFAHSILSWFDGLHGRLDPSTARRALAYAQATGDTILENDATSQLGFRLMMGAGTWDEVDAFVQETRERLGEHIVAAARWPAEALFARGRFAEARASVSTAIELLRERGAEVIAWWQTGLRGFIDLHGGDPAAAEDDLRAAWLGLGERKEHGLRSTIGCLRAEALVELGRTDEARHVLDEVDELTSEGDFVTVALAQAARAKIALIDGDPERAVALAVSATELVDATDYLYIRPTFWLRRGEVLLAAGRRDEARAAFAECIRLAELKGTVIFASRARELLAAL